MDRPQGYCPNCGYPVNPGVCSECGIAITPGNIRHAPRKFPLRLLLRLSVFVVLAIGVNYCIRRIDFVKHAPTTLLFRFRGSDTDRINQELCERLNRDELNVQEVRRFYEKEISGKIDYSSQGGFHFYELLGHSPNNFQFFFRRLNCDGRIVELNSDLWSFGRCSEIYPWPYSHKSQGCSFSHSGIDLGVPAGAQLRPGFHDVSVDFEVVVYRLGSNRDSPPVARWTQNVRQQVEISNGG